MSVKDNGTFCLWEEITFKAGLSVIVRMPDLSASGGSPRESYQDSGIEP